MPRLAAAAAIALTALIGCDGGEDKETVTMPTGLEIEVPTEGSEEEQITATIDALYDRLDYTDRIEECGRENVDDLLTPARVRQIEALPESRRQEERVRLMIQMEKRCIESDDQVVRTDAGEETLDVLRYQYKQAVELELRKPPAASEAVIQCALARVDSIPREELIPLVNGPVSGIKTFFFDIGRDCASRAGGFS
jgi:hypothetical protein